eukprot:CAMPEP_0168361958 /NCGR_PEP_ID=MMETSP0228-20121227/2931_1 /TAXON_ID=133427 /ORGANISM="Protoceratium reticulatum, Strain CCCM 535 (=CCMP 1889)" /LENGTH=57 /DNA_ID=CAMNT_0008374645 /DNA_START=101 /DNA_END=274 /DNA_ORIENTATION=+
MASIPASISSFSCLDACTNLFVSYSESVPIGCTSSTPLGPNVALKVKKGNSVMEDIT